VELNDIGAPNLNVFTKIPSVQGYGSLTWGAYADATGTHGQNRAAPAAFATDVFDSLDVRALLVLPWAFRTDVTPANPGLVSLAASAPTTRYFGGTVDVTSIEISTDLGVPRSVLGSDARAIRLLGAQGRHAPSRVVVATNSATAYFGRGLASVGLTLAGAGGGPTALAVAVTTAKGAAFSPTGLLAADVTPPHWRITGSIGAYELLTDTRAFGPLTAFSPSGEERVAAAIRVVSSSPWTPTETVAVDAAHPVLLVRSVADLPGWHATVTEGGRVVRTTLQRHGVVQAIELPAGKSIVTFEYSPPGLRTGLVLAAAGCALLVALLVADVFRARRRENTV
jgi:hypothetical protein